MIMHKNQNKPEVIPWNKSYEIGHELIDSQHKIFLMLLNKLSVTIANGVTKEHMFRVLNELKKYAEFHFLSEENVMHECYYPGIDHHKRIHTEILNVCHKVVLNQVMLLHFLNHGYLNIS
jgi:hemerythrin